MLCSNLFWCPGSASFQKLYEPLFNAPATKVDLFYAGHVHAAEVQYPQLGGVVQQENFDNMKVTMQVMVGFPGDIEVCCNDWVKPKPAYSFWREDDVAGDGGLFGCERRARALAERERTARPASDPAAPPHLFLRSLRVPYCQCDAPAPAYVSRRAQRVGGCARARARARCASITRSPTSFAPSLSPQACTTATTRPSCSSSGRAAPCEESILGALCFCARRVVHPRFSRSHLCRLLGARRASRFRAATTSVHKAEHARVVRVASLAGRVERVVAAAAVGRARRRAA